MTRQTSSSPDIYVHIYIWIERIPKQWPQTVGFLAIVVCGMLAVESWVWNLGPGRELPRPPPGLSGGESGLLWESLGVLEGSTLPEGVERSGRGVERSGRGGRTLRAGGSNSPGGGGSNAP